MVVVEVNGYTIEPGANLEGVDLSWARFREPRRLTPIGHPVGDVAVAQLQGANLTGANLEGAKANEFHDLYRSESPTINLYDSHDRTVWPKGFDPVAAGVIFE